MQYVEFYRHDYILHSTFSPDSLDCIYILHFEIRRNVSTTYYILHITFCIFVNGPKKSGYDSTYYILHFSISRFGLHTTFYICDFECLLKLHTTFYIFDFRPGTYIRHLHLPVGEVNRAASTFYIWRVNNMRANSYTYYIPDPAYIRPALVAVAYTQKWRHFFFGNSFYYRLSGSRLSLVLYLSLNNT